MESTTKNPTIEELHAELQALREFANQLLKRITMLELRHDQSWIDSHFKDK